MCMLLDLYIMGYHVRNLISRETVSSIRILD